MTIIDVIQRLQGELLEIQQFQQGYLDARARRGRKTATDIVMKKHQQTLAETLDLLETLKAEKREGEQ